MRRAGLIALVLAWMVMACTSASSGGGTGGGAPSSGSGTTAQAPADTSKPQRVMVMATRVEPKTIAARGLGQNTGVALYLTKRVFNADLALLDDQGTPRPYLADSLPQLNTDTWKVNADGTMETNYHLRPNLVWHDGQPLTADDFVFAFQVYARQDLGTANSPPINLIQD
ncbi:MAG: oligopeptide transport system substrate-binding protein, partial [Chloroflexota bacterium]|nr:oligopeptide transport system substrate-binding protein [Chloroflexota bacterium]